MEQIEYIHYGATKFDPSKGFPIKNTEYPWTKLVGGLWASRSNASCGWKNWCIEEDFEDCCEENSFSFTIKPSANVIRVSNRDDLAKLPNKQVFTYGQKSIFDLFYIDFEECLAMGIDAIELCYYGEEYKSLNPRGMYYALYGWDCDSIVILNPDIVQTDVL